MDSFSSDRLDVINLGTHFRRERQFITCRRLSQTERERERERGKQRKLHYIDDDALPNQVSDAEGGREGGMKPEGIWHLVGV